jgi:hypothetical protein
MLKPFLAALTFAALGLSLPLVAEAGPTVQAITGGQVALDEACIATITWDEMQGGKPLFIRVVFQYGNETDGYTTSLEDGADGFHKVKQNAGSLELDFGAIAANQPTVDSYRVKVIFVDRKDNPLSSEMSAISNCGAV